MRSRILFTVTAVFTVALLSAGSAWAQRPAAKDDGTNPRTARYRRVGQLDQSQQRHDLRGLEEDGSKLTVSNPSNPKSDWCYVTLFDGVFRPVKGQQGAETAVEIINPKSIRIYNKRNGVLNQVVINTLSDDNNTISNEYIRMDKDGKITGVTHVTYIRRKK